MSVGKRRHKDHARDDFRGEFERDRDRVLYSSAFRRLAGVTQVAAVSEQRVLHNRLTHSLKVGQLARRIAQSLKHESEEKAARCGVDADVAETAGLAHDIGHPPFGHIAEGVLDKRLKRFEGIEGFEGNAQSFRIVTKLATRRTKHEGLNLTKESLDAILKYPRTKADEPVKKPHWNDRGRGEKWGVYRSELEDFRFARQGDRRHLRCANATIMDWADDITYATHDIEDYFRAGLIPLHDLWRDSDELVAHGVKRLDDGRGFKPARFEEALEKVLHVFNGWGRGRLWDTRKNRAWLNEVTSRNLTELVSAARIVGRSPRVKIDTSAQYLVEALKELTFFYVIDRPPLAMAQEGQKKIIGDLFDQLCECLRQAPDSPKIPVTLREDYAMLEKTYSGNESSRRARAVVDYICLLTDGQAVDLGERLSGAARTSMFGAWF
ncbi:deoxyguanosinetriphosphate triphosphohydrolase family protein [Amycolatopsis sp. YIM 10]|uniref:deoxyguanosinetriphosphate triphosphohydrolase family protein n=1 Tax=Amycolatopsis sp. YIM 10 TaxID=2653857 RepID=UPI0012902CB4|nr:dNTP triphosphohydrolase [Amycolatopsis sp. YIM 10]QFU86209.1 Deoxyguanosinetriphosphate triphosphohydrolase [Amycolatopsis sp. YIM 10]